MSSFSGIFTFLPKVPSFSYNLCLQLHLSSSFSPRLSDWLSGLPLSYLLLYSSPHPLSPPLAPSPSERIHLLGLCSIERFWMSWLILYRIHYYKLQHDQQWLQHPSTQAAPPGWTLLVNLLCTAKNFFLHNILHIFVLVMQVIQVKHLILYLIGFILDAGKSGVYWSKVRV